jgi:chemotaxis signal transduction protein
MTSTRSNPAFPTAFERQYLCFVLGGQPFAIPLAQVREVLEVPCIARVPRTEPWLLGVINLRGTILSVVDISSFLASHLDPQGEASRLIVVSSSLFDAALRVDAVREILALGPDDVARAAAGFQGADGLALGVCDRGGQPFTLLDLDALLNLEPLKSHL